MAFESDLRTYLLSKAAITAIVSQRVYPLLLPQGAARPAITYQVLANEHVKAMGGAQGMARPRLQISCWADSYSTAKSLADALRVAMDGFNSTMGSGPGTRVRGAFLEDQQDLYDPPQTADQVGIYHVAQTWRMAHAETIPTL